jgi:Mg-chelatase subunit ChlD
MSPLKCLVGAVLLVLGLAALAPARAQAPGSKPLSEADVLKLVELGLDDEVIVARLGRAGLSFAADDAAVERLKKAGASAAVLAAVRKAGAGNPGAPGPAVTYADVLKLLELGIPEPEIRKRLEKSPSRFTLDAGQVAELRKAGASDALLEAMQKGPAVSRGTDIGNFAVILDCSGSMRDRTPDGTAKMEAAKKVVTRFIQDLPNGKRLTFIVYGHKAYGDDRKRGCEAVEVVLPLSELTDPLKEQLARTIAQLQPLGWTPLASSLRLAGQELRAAKGMCQVIVVTDGMETCDGDPAKEAEALNQQLSLPGGVDIIGFNVTPEEKKAVEEVVARGRGKYYDSSTAQDLIKAVKEAGERARVEAERKALEVREPAQPAAREGPPQAGPVTLKGGLPGISCLAFSPDGKTLALGGDSGSRSTPSDTVELWDVTTGKRRQLLREHPGNVSSLAFSADGNTLAVGSYKQVFLWDPAGGDRRRILKGHTADVSYVQFSPDGKSLFSASRSEARWCDPASGDGQELVKDDAAQWLLSPDARALVRYSYYWNNVVFRDLGKGKETMSPAQGYTVCAACSADSRTAATGASENVLIWDALTGKKLASHGLHSAKVISVDLTADGKTVASGSEDRTVILWDVTAKKERATLEGHAGPAAARFTPDGRTVVSWSSADKAVRLWDAAGKERGRLEGHKAAVIGVAFSADSTLLATAGKDGTALLWTLAGVPAEGK